MSRQAALRHFEPIRREKPATVIVRQLRTLIARSTDWYWKTDPQHRLMHVTHEAERTNDTLKANLGRKWWQFHRSGGQAADAGYCYPAGL